MGETSGIAWALLTCGLLAAVPSAASSKSSSPTIISPKRTAKHLTWHEYSIPVPAGWQQKSYEFTDWGDLSFLRTSKTPPYTVKYTISRFHEPGGAYTEKQAASYVKQMAQGIVPGGKKVLAASNYRDTATLLKMVPTRFLDNPAYLVEHQMNDTNLPHGPVRVFRDQTIFFMNAKRGLFYNVALSVRAGNAGGAREAFSKELLAWMHWTHSINVITTK